MSASTVRQWILCCLVLSSLSTASVIAGTFNGTIEEVSADDRTVTVKLAGKSEESMTFELVTNTAIVIDGKKGKLEDIVEGQTVIVVVNAAEVTTKLTVKTPKMSATKKPVPKKSKDDEPTPKADEPAEKPSEDSWPQHRGPKRDNISREQDLLDKWPAGGPKVAWQQKGIGEGYSSVSISQGKLFTMGNQGDDEVVQARDSSTGKLIWEAKSGGKAYRDGGQGNGPRGTPTVDDDRVYALGANGDLVCLGTAKGEVVWQKNILNEYGGSNITWGISESVLVDGKNVICSPGGSEATMVAIDKMTGRDVWRAVVDGTPQAAYSSPILVEFQGERMYVNYVHTAVVAFRAKDGNVIWGNAESANDTANCSTPLYADGQVYTSSGYGKGAAMFKLLKGGKAKLGYANKEMVNHHGGMVLLDGHVYGFDEQILKCIDLKSGKTVWKDRSVGKGSLTCADGHLYLRGENGSVALCDVSTKGYQERGRFEPPNRSERPAWSHPVVCGGRMYLRDMDSIVVYDLKKN